MHSFSRGILWKRPQWYSAIRCVALLPRWVCELNCQTFYSTDYQSRTITIVTLLKLYDIMKSFAILRDEIVENLTSNVFVSRNIKPIKANHSHCGCFCDGFLLQSSMFSRPPSSPLVFRFLCCTHTITSLVKMISYVDSQYFARHSCTRRVIHKILHKKKISCSSKNLWVIVKCVWLTTEIWLPHTDFAPANFFSVNSWTIINKRFSISWINSSCWTDSFVMLWIQK